MKQSTLVVLVSHLMPVIVNLTSKAHLKAKWKVSMDKEDFIRCDIQNCVTNWLANNLHSDSDSWCPFIHQRESDTSERYQPKQNYSAQKGRTPITTKAASSLLIRSTSCRLHVVFFCFGGGNVHVRVRLIYLLLIQWQFNFLTALNGNIIMFN